MSQCKDDIFKVWLRPITNDELFELLQVNERYRNLNARTIDRIMALIVKRALELRDKRGEAWSSLIRRAVR
jgi:hypothetical protein